MWGRLSNPSQNRASSIIHSRWTCMFESMSMGLFQKKRLKVMSMFILKNLSSSIIVSLNTSSFCSITSRNISWMISNPFIISIGPDYFWKGSNCFWTLKVLYWLTWSIFCTISITPQTNRFVWNLSQPSANSLKFQTHKPANNWLDCSLKNRLSIKGNFHSIIRSRRLK